MQDEIARILDKSAGIYERLVLDKSAGIYERLGGPQLLCLAVCKAERATEEASHAARAYASFLQDSYGPSINGVRDGASNLCTAVGGLLAVLDVILATDGYNPQLLDREKDLCTAYTITLRGLEQNAREQGLPDDYSMTRERAKRFQANGLVRPCIVEKQRNNNP